VQQQQAGTFVLVSGLQYVHREAVDVLDAARANAGGKRKLREVCAFLHRFFGLPRFRGPHDAAL
jgi:hypothetical protein